MLFNLALISGFIIAPAVLAHLWSGFPDRVQLSTYDVTDGVLYNPYSSGAMWNEPYYGYFELVAGILQVPALDISVDGYAYAYVAIGGYGDTCSSTLEAGVILGIQDSEPYYRAYYHWYLDDTSFPDEVGFPNITVSAGDSIDLFVSSSSDMTGQVTFNNYSQNQTVTVSLTSPRVICGMSAWWIVQEDVNSPLALGTVNFTDAVALGPSDSYAMSPEGATTIIMQDQDQSLSSVVTGETYMVITYLF